MNTDTPGSRKPYDSGIDSELPSGQFSGVVEDGKAVLRCRDCQQTVPVTEAPDHTCGDEPVLLAADGGSNLFDQLSAFQRDILCVVRRIETGASQEGTPYGLAIKRDLQRVRDTEIYHGRLYPNLDQLVGHGLIEKKEIDDRTNRYSTTDDGKRFLNQHAEWAVEGAAARTDAELTPVRGD